MLVAHLLRSCARAAPMAALAFVMSAPAARADGDITIQYSVSPAADAVKAGINVEFATVSEFAEIADTLKSSDVPAGDLGSQPSAAFVKWKDNTITSFPLFLVAAFEKRSVEVDFAHVSVSEGNVASIVGASCTSKSPASIEDAFDIMASCGATERWLRSTNRQFSPLAMKSLNSWLVANHFLYIKKTGTIQFSPYGLEEDLIDALKEVAAKIDENPGRAKDFLPIKRGDITSTLNDKDQETVRMAAFVPALVKNGRLPEAFSANKVALEAFQKLSGGDSTKVIVNVTGDLLKDNAKYISTLAAQSKVNLPM